MHQRRIYALTGLPPEVVAVTFAKCSRSPEPFDKIAAELNEDKSRKFHEKWVVGYGHSSVAEHAVLSLAIENVSILATKVIEDNRLASYTEKSSRYQVFDMDKYYIPELNERLKKLYIETCNYLLDVYSEIISILIDFFKKKFPDEPEIKNKALDVARYLLPVSVLTNLGMTINARSLENAIIKLLTNPFKEMQEIGKEIKNAALKITPTLIKYADFNKYISETIQILEKVSKEKISDKDVVRDDVILVEYDKDAEDRLITALLYKFSNSSYNNVKNKIKKFSKEKKNQIINEALKRMSRYDKPVRELEHIYYTFDILVDYGAFRDIQRHRICTQTNQEFSVDYGYSIPNEMIDAGLKEKFIDCMEKAKKAFFEIKKEFPKEAQYIIPLAYKKRLLMTMNLRECFHFIKLRSGKTGHKSYRDIAKKMYKLIEEVHPFIAKYIQVDLS